MAVSKEELSTFGRLSNQEERKKREEREEREKRKDREDREKRETAYGQRGTVQQATPYTVLLMRRT